MQRGFRIVRCDPYFSDKHRLQRAKFMAISQRRQTSLRRTGLRLPLAERSRELSPRIQPTTNSTSAARSLRPPQGLDPNLQCCVHRHEPGFRCTLEVVPHEAHQQATEDLALYEARAAWRRSGQDSKEMLAIEDARHQQTAQPTQFDICICYQDARLERHCSTR